MDSRLTLQIFLDGAWHDAVQLNFPIPEQGREGESELEYIFDYAINHFERYDLSACSALYPVELSHTRRHKPWFAFIDDIMPAGAARRFWVNQLGLENLPRLEQDFTLLKTGCIAPVGNMRIKEALPLTSSGQQIPKQTFTVTDVLERNTDFLQYANEMGAVGGGATGAGGEAPKLVIRCNKQSQVWIDAYQDDLKTTDTHYLVKFPRNRQTEIDKDILRAEFHYYHTLTELGINTIDTEKMKLLEHDDLPSLWLPRFDLGFIDDQLNHFGLESVFSLLELPPGSNMAHLTVVTELVKLLSSMTHNFNAQSFVNEWVKRDFLNVVFGNSDNHGRNTAFLKKPGRPLQLSPVYDFAPMKADPEGVIRTTRWGEYEMGGQFEWLAIAQALENELQGLAEIKADSIINELKTLAPQLTGLKERLAKQGVPESILNFPAIGFDYLDKKLNTWGLL